MTWTKRELAILETTSRVSSVFSILGAGFIIVTFLSSKSFHRPINRLAFFAAFGNILTNVATIMAQDPQAGTAACKMQGFLIQWFIPADALFCSAMALNVYLTVFKKYTSDRLQQLEIYYICTCYGIPLIPAFTFLFIETESKGPMYGNAVLWCWIARDWQIWRLASFYGPVWIVIFFTFTIYVMAGRVIFSLRDSLRKFARESPNGTELSQSRYRESIVNKPPMTANSLQRVPTFTSTATPILSDPSPMSATVTTTVSMMDGRRSNMNGMSMEPSYTVVIETGRVRNAVEANTAAWAYCRCAMLFFLALLITWLPSSINRIYTVVYPNATNFGLNFASVLVLPCQGFWNGLIYIVTTYTACQELGRECIRVLKDPRKAWRERHLNTNQTMYHDRWKQSRDTKFVGASDEELAGGRLG